jgi:hypothetical protein
MSNLDKVSTSCYKDRVSDSNSDEPKKPTVVKLLEPEMCLGCRFAQQAIVTTEDGLVQRMIKCKRGDCDNWDHSESEGVLKIENI